MTAPPRLERPRKAGGKPSHHDDLRGDLLRVGLEILRDEGPHKLTIRGLARALKVSHGAPASYFPNRESLLVALVMEAMHRLQGALAGAVDLGVAPPEQLRRLGLAYVQFAMEDRGAYAALMLPGLPESQELNELRAHTFRITVLAVERLLDERPGPQPNPEEVAAVLWSSIHGLCSLLIAGHIGSLLGETQQEQAVARLFEAFLSRYP